MTLAKPKFTLALFAFCLSITNPVWAQDDSALQRLDNYVEKAREEWQVPGVAVAIVKDDKIVYAKGFGVREVGKPAQVDAETVFAIGSATKPFAAAALGLLVDEGKISWDGPVRSVMPSFELHDPYVTRHVTVRDLLSHRTGVRGAGWLWSGSGFDREEIIRRLQFQEQSLGFRNRWDYNNEMYILAGELVPAVTGISWDDFVQQRIFAPLGMMRSNTSISKLQGLPNVATPHALIKGEPVPIEHRNIDNVGAAGAINSSAMDMAQWVRLQLKSGSYEGQKILARETVEEMHSPQVALPKGVFAEMMPEAHIGTYGLGWVVHDYRGEKVVQHAGAIDGMMSVVAMIPEEQLGVVILTNRYPHQLPYALAFRIFDIFRDGPKTDWSATMKAQLGDASRTLADTAPPAASGNAAPPTLPLSSLTGTYTSSLYGDIQIRLEDGQLALIRGGSAAVLQHKDQHLFHAQWKSPGFASIMGKTPIGFTTGPTGEVLFLEMQGDKYIRREKPANSPNSSQ